MAEDEGKPPSFNPHTWLPGKPLPASAPATPPPPRQDATAPERLSLDPKAWAPRPAAGPKAVKSKSSAPLLIGLGIVVLLGAGGAWWAFKPDPLVAGAAPNGAVATTPAASSATRSIVLSGPAELPAALAASGAAPGDVATASAEALKLLGPAQGELRLALTLSGPAPQRIDRLEALTPSGAGAVLVRSGETFKGEVATAELTVRDQVVRGEMDADSFYSSAVAAGVTDSLIPEFAQAFAFDFDFQREIKPGDIFEAVFRERVNAQGQAVGPPQLLFAGLTTDAKSAALYRFTPEGQEPGWFDGNGRSVVRAFMRTPVDGARVSSNFGYRKHPILGYQKLHRGVDFAAPTGTPIFAAGDGVVEFAGPKGPNGNFVALRHDNGWRTLYLHMNAFGEGVVTGARLRQGQQLGEVGTTGRSTGPHLHYEVHIDGEPVDPMTVQVGEGRTLTGPALEAFVKTRNQIDQVRRQAG